MQNNSILISIFLGLTFLFNACFFKNDKKVELRESSHDRELKKIIKDIIKAEYEFEPSIAIINGEHDYYKKIENYKPDNLMARLEELYKFLEILNKIDINSLNPLSKEDYQIALYRVKYQIWRFERGRDFEKDITIYTYIPMLATQKIIMDESLTAQDRLKILLYRFENLAKLVDSGIINLKGLNKIKIFFGIDTLEGSMEFLNWEVTPFLNQLSSKEKVSYIKGINTLFASLKRFISFLEDQFQYGGAVQDARLGELELVNLLKNKYLIDYSLERLIEIAQLEMQRLDKKIVQLARSIDSLKNPTQLIFEINQGEFHEYPNQDQLASSLQKSFLLARDFVIKNELVTFPKNEKIDFMILPSLFLGFKKLGTYEKYISLDKINEEFVAKIGLPRINLNLDEYQLKEFFSRYTSEKREVISVHLGYPGQHLQNLVTKSLPSEIRKNSQSLYFEEGWKLYSEDLMSELGFISDRAKLWVIYKQRKLFEMMVNVIRFHSKRISMYEAEEIRGLDASHLFPEYFIINSLGYFEIKNLRQDFIKADNGKINPKDLLKFHDKLLSYGEIPFSLIKKFIFYKEN